MTVTNARIIADTFNPNHPDIRITSFEIEYPRYILAEINTHRILSRSSASSRAIPLKKRIEDVAENPFVPDVFGKNKPGMQSDEPLAFPDDEAARYVWRDAAYNAAFMTKELAALNVHKQQAGRLLEPFVYVKTIITGTEWENFFNLRNNDAADPEFHKLAEMMQKLYESSHPEESDYHLPYLKDNDIEYHGLETCLKMCVARCARISYTLHDGGMTTPGADLALYDVLAEKKHLSPFDHVAFAGDKQAYRQYYGFIPLRAFFERVNHIQCSRLNENEYYSTMVLNRYTSLIGDL